MTLTVPLCLIVLMIGLTAGGVLHHREHAAARERGLTPDVNNRRPYGGSSHGGLGNYVGGIAPPLHDGGEEKLRVIKITRTYAIPYPYPVSVPFAKENHHHQLYPASIPNSNQAHAGYKIGVTGYNTNFNPNGHNNNYHSSGGISSGYNYEPPRHLPRLNEDRHPVQSYNSHDDFTHSNALDSSFDSFFSGHGSDSKDYSVGPNHYSGSGNGYSLSRDNVYQRHGYSSAKPFRPSQEYTPRELNEPLYSHGNPW